MSYSVEDEVEVAGRAAEGFPHCWFPGVITKVHRSTNKAVSDVLEISYPVWISQLDGEVERDEHPALSLRVRPALPRRLVPANLAEYQVRFEPPPPSCRRRGLAAGQDPWACCPCARTHV